MFQIREDVYRRRELADKLKIAFATAAHAGLGLLTACSVAGKNGLYLYAGSTALCFASAALSMRRNRDRQIPSYAAPFNDIAPVARKIAQKAGIEPPQVFHAAFEEGASPAYTDGKSVFFDTKFLNGKAAPDIASTLAHEIAHIKNRDAIYANMILVPLSRANTTVLPLLALNGIFTPSLRQVLLSLLLMTTARGFREISEHINNFASRARESRADRHAARWTDCPLDRAVDLEKMAREQAAYLAQRQVKKPEKYSSTWSLLAEHPDTGDRVRDIVTLCKRVPDPPAEKPPAPSL